DNNTANLPTTAVAYAPIVVVDKDGGIPINNADACTQSYLVNNASRLFLVPVYNLSSNHQAGVFLEFINKAIDVATALAPIIRSGEMPNAIADKLSDVQKTTTPINNLLATLNETDNYASTKNLQLGETVITTDYATITVRVRPVSSIVEDKNQDFLDDLKKGI